jgi:ATPase subunit of ABC transporter with duplicated ATPase domains
MIRIENISKQNSHRILFLEASAALNRGEKIGLVGPNGAGKTTLFRMITGEEVPDEGQVSVEKNVTIGYFNQDVGEMAGRSAVAEVIAGAGPVSAVAAELHRLEAEMVDPEQMDRMDEIIERYGEVQSRFEELDGYGLESRAREVLAGLSFSEEMMDGDVGKLSGGWKMRVALARILLMRPDAMLLDEPSNHLDIESLIWLEEFLQNYDGALLMTSHDRAFMNRIVGKIIEIDGGALTSYSGDYEFYERQRAEGEKQQQAQFERQQAMLAKEIKFIERFKARASHAAQVQSRVKKLDKIERVEPPRRRQAVAFDFRPAPRSGEDVASLKGVHKQYGQKVIYDGFDFMIKRRGEIDALEADCGREQAGSGHGADRGERQDGLFRSACDGPARRRPHGVRMARRRLSAGGPGVAQDIGRLLRLLGRRPGEEVPGAVGWREGAAGDGAHAVRSAEPARARRADQPSRPRHQGDADQGAFRLRGDDDLRQPRPAFSRGAVEPGAGADARGDPPL